MRKHAFSVCILFAIILCPWAHATLTVTDGLAPYQMLQCNDAGAATLVCSGSRADAAKAPVEARVLRENDVVLDWREVGAAENGAWRATLDGIPQGGPYAITLRAGDDLCTVENVFAGDLWALAGQSNMQGVGNMMDVVPPHPLVTMLAMNGEWRAAGDPLHILQESIDLVHFRPENDEQRQAAIAAAKVSPKGAGLGMSFAVEMAQRTGRPVGLVCAAHGGTSMEQWSPDKRDMGGESLYGSLLAQIARAGGTVRGVLWYQGESDANPDASGLFRDKFENFVAALRRDLDAPELPFYYVQIGRFVHPDPVPAPWNLVQSMQLATEKTIPHAGMVAAIDLELDDLIHVGTQGLKRLGKRLANLAERDLYGGSLLAGPRPEKAVYAETPHGKQIHVSFSQVNGALTAPGRPVGFSISSGAEGAPIPRVYKVDLPNDTPDTAVLWVHELPEDAHVWYGRGLDPCANITDEADMAVPVFGPLPVER